LSNIYVFTLAKHFRTHFYEDFLGTLFYFCQAPLDTISLFTLFWSLSICMELWAQDLMFQGFLIAFLDSNRNSWTAYGSNTRFLPTEDNADTKRRHSQVPREI